ncbi:MAG TPA: hypothetical protein VGF17_27365, partial [Phytomonospora sp.]
MASGEQDRPQKKPAVAPYLAALAAIGLATFAFLGWIVGFRETHPITASAPAAAVDGVPTAGA